jgi:hypothetical protein
MARPCTICRDPRLPEIAADLNAGMTNVAIAQRYGLSLSAVQRHHQHSGAPNSTAIAARKTAAFMALAALPTREEAGSALSAIGDRIDAIAAKAEQEGSLAIALMGLKELRTTVMGQAQLAGHVGSGTTVAVQTNVNVDLGGAVKEIIAALRPRRPAGVPRQPAVHLAEPPPDERALKRLEAVIDADAE